MGARQVWLVLLAMVLLLLVARIDNVSASQNGVRRGRARRHSRASTHRQRHTFRRRRTRRYDILAMGAGAVGAAPSVCVPKKPRQSGVDKADAPGNVSVITVTNVGGDGQYWEVAKMTMGAWPRCTVPKQQLCVKKAVRSRGALSPFDDEMAVNFGGPMHIFNIGVYSPGADGNWNRDGYYDTCGAENLAWMKDSRGGGTNAGEWNMCWGGSQSYASADGTGGASTLTHFNGYLPAGHEIHITSPRPCSAAGECGFVYGLGMHGFKGDAFGQKMFVMHVQMPHQPGTNNDPLITMGPVKVFNTKQYGCNCRGMGPFGGCGEIDVHETLKYEKGKTVRQGYFTMYTYQGVTGSGQPYFIRPDKDSAIYVAIFKKVSASKGKVQLMRLPRGSFTFPRNVSASFLNNWLSKSDIVRRMPDRDSLPLPPP